MWLIDDAGEPVRKAAIWLDGRAGARIGAWEKDGRGAAVLATTGTVTFPGLVPILFEELTEAEPDVMARAATHLNCKDWLRYKLTGQRLTDYTEASRSLLDISTNAGFSEKLAEQLKLPGLLKVLPPIVPADGPAVPLSSEAAADLGLPAGTPVGIGMIDVAVTGVGVGALGDNQGWLISGTTGFVGVNLPSAAVRRSTASMVLSLGRGQQVLEFLAPMTGTPNLDWVRDSVGWHDESWDVVEARVREAAPGSGGVVYLPYGSPSGERAPFSDPTASASWHGLSITTTPAQIARSVYEGVVFSLVECMEVLGLEGTLIVTGGGFGSDLLGEILAAASGRQVARQNDPEAAARGAATLALVSAGVVADLADATAQMAPSISYFEPDPKVAAATQAAYQQYLAIRDIVRPTWPALRELRALGQDA